MGGTTSKMGIPYPDNNDFVTDGATDMQAIADQVDLKTGLIKITPSSVSGTGASIASNGDVTVSSGGANFTVNGCFSSDYVNYKIIISDFRSSIAAAVRLALGTAAGTTEYRFSEINVSTAGVVGGSGNAGTSSFICPIVSRGTTDSAGGEITLFSPQQSIETSFICLATDSDTSGPYRQGAGRVLNNTAYTACYFLLDTATFTSIRVSIYGYN